MKNTNKEATYKKQGFGHWIALDQEETLDQLYLILGLTVTNNTEEAKDKLCDLIRIVINK